MNWSGVIMLNILLVVHMQSDLTNDFCLWKSLYFSLVHLHLAYGNMLWGTAYLHRLHRLIMIQKCVRNVCNVPYNTESSCLFKQLGMPKFVDIMPIQLKFVSSCMCTPMAICL